MENKFKEYLKNTKIKEIFIEYDFRKVTTLFEDTMQEYLETVVGEDDEKMLAVFKLFYVSSYKQLTVKNSYGNRQVFELI